MFNYFSSISYPKFKLAILVLLTLNAVIYAIVDTLTSAIDAWVWLVLLVLYELEANDVAPLAKNTLHGIRNVLIAVIVLVFVSYVHHREWLDVVNSALWFALIALLELEVRWPDKVSQYWQSYRLATVTIFAGLIAVVIAWAWQSTWLAVYDATLWIVAFSAIEMDIFQILQRNSV
jgi:hypothetical protein